MKKMMNVMAMTVLVALSLSMVAIAEEQLKVKGKVTKIDMETRSVTIKPKSGAEITVMMEDASKLAEVQVDEKREVAYVTVDGKNIGSKIRRFSGGCE
jgi:predicted RNA-binding protein